MAVLVDSSLSGPSTSKEWCPRASGSRQRAAGERRSRLVPDYEISADVGERVIRLGDRGRASGVSVPLSDLLVFACAKIHGLGIAHDDGHFDELAKLEA